jgi:hypothetical protein
LRHLYTKKECPEPVLVKKKLQFLPRQAQDKLVCFLQTPAGRQAEKEWRAFLQRRFQVHGLLRANVLLVAALAH